MSYVASRAATRPWTAKRSPFDDRMSNVPTRRYDVAWLKDDGASSSLARMAPALPLFEEAFSAFARGGLIQTSEGAIAVEDLIPGMMIETASGLSRLAWIGAITLLPENGIRGNGLKLYRVTADAFGLDRPMPDLMLGTGARVLSRSAAVQALAGPSGALVPIKAFTDGSSVIEVSPVSPVRIFHLGFHGHRILRVNGLESESFHPGQIQLGRLGPDMGALFMSLFPHVRDMGGFGRLAMPRLPEDEIDFL